MMKNKLIKFGLIPVFLFQLLSCSNNNTSVISSNDKISTFNKDTSFENEVLTPKQKEIVAKYAPIVFQETNETKGGKPSYWDFMTICDFDGDLIGKNNEENLKASTGKLPATLYYALIESKTHYFITYSSFHPLDWSPSTPAIPYNWHENDMENLQVVVRKATGKLEETPIILSTQAHTKTGVSAALNSGIESSKKKLEKEPVRLFDDNIADGGTHSGVYIESGGHGIHNMNSEKARFATLTPPKLKEGFTFMPSMGDSPDYYKIAGSSYFYQLKSTHDLYWMSYVKNENIGQGKLMDGDFDYKDELVDYKKLPRFFDSDRLSGPAKKDSGILPFAFSFTLTEKDLGVIFFNPAKKYKNELKIQGDWSLEYVYNPYLKR